MHRPQQVFSSPAPDAGALCCRTGSSLRLRASRALCFEAMPEKALLVQAPNHVLDHAVLLQAAWRDELLVQAVASNQTRVVPAGEHQPIV